MQGENRPWVKKVIPITCMTLPRLIATLKEK
jgi:hypothetical protein